MKKRRFIWLLGLMLFMSLFSVRAEEQARALYTGKLQNGAVLLSAPDPGSQRMGYVPEGKEVQILAVEPAWLLVVYKDAPPAYIKRNAMRDTSVKPLDPVRTPPYATTENTWLAWVKGEAPIRALPDEDAETLTTLYNGARISLIDITDGWGQVIYLREYGYINTNHLSVIQRVNRAAQPEYEEPLAAYTSFYKVTSDQSNKNRIVNLRVACERFPLYVLKPGDSLDFNRQIGPYTRKLGYLPANVIRLGEVVQGYGGGTCQVSSTLYNVVLQLPGIEVIRRRSHGAEAAQYLPHGADAAVGSTTQNFIIKNQYPFPVRIDGTLQDGALTIALYRAD